MHVEGISRMFRRWLWIVRQFGAQGITVHPRPDERHIRFSDVDLLKPLVTTEFNIEGYPSKSFIELVCRVKPDQVTLVPDPPEALTSSAGWDTLETSKFPKGGHWRVSEARNPDFHFYRYRTRTHRGSCQNGHQQGGTLYRTLCHPISCWCRSSHQTFFGSG